MSKPPPVSKDNLCVNKKGFGILKQGNEQCVEWLQKYLTVKPRINPEAPASTAKEFSVYRKNSRKIYIPVSLGFKLFGAPLPDNYTLPEGETRPNLRFNGKLRPEQEGPVASFLASAKHPNLGMRGGIISLACAAGKTVMGLYIVCAIGKKALIVCHKEFLINQWRERIAQFVPTAKVGLIKGKVVDVEDKDIILASLQSLSMKEYPASVFEGLHTFVGDEIHHYSAEVFSRALTNTVTPVSLGLSATLDRADGLRKVFEWYVGKPVVLSKAKRTDTDLIVEMIQYYDPHPDFGRELFVWGTKRNIPRMQTNICNFEPRNRLIIDKVEEILKREPERRVLILSHRRAHLQQLEIMLLDKKLGSIGYYVGGMKEADLKESETKDIMLGTYNMIAEGFDVPALNTLILTTSMSSIEQSIGRIQRQKPEDRKYTPYVVDIWDTFSLFRNQGNKRLQFYKKNGYQVIGDIESEDTEPKKYSFIEEEDT